MWGYYNKNNFQELTMFKKTHTIVCTSILLVIIIATIATSLKAMEEGSSTQFHAIIIPEQKHYFIGFGGTGGEEYEHYNVINTNNILRTEPLDTLWFDFGQDNCINHFENQLHQYKSDKNLDDENFNPILYAISHGTATIINWLTQQSHEEQEKIKCLILESVIGSGNTNIINTYEKTDPLLTFVPFARLLLPLEAKIVYPTYNPWGKQLLSSAKKLSPTIPVIIMHSIDDILNSTHDGRQLYCTLLEQRAINNVYLLEFKDLYKDYRFFDPVTLSYQYPHNHICILCCNVLCGVEEDEKKIFRAIYKKHGLPFAKMAAGSKGEDNDEDNLDDIDLTEFQPSLETVKQKINNKKNYISNFARNSIDFLFVSLLVWWCYYYEWIQ